MTSILVSLLTFIQHTEGLSCRNWNSAKITQEQVLYLITTGYLSLFLKIISLQGLPSLAHCAVEICCQKYINKWKWTLGKWTTGEGPRVPVRNLLLLDNPHDCSSSVGLLFCSYISPWQRKYTVFNHMPKVLWLNVDLLYLIAHSSLSTIECVT